VVAVSVKRLRVGESELLVETVAVAGTERTSKLDDAREEVGDAFERARRAIVDVATETVAAVREAGERAARPQRIEVEFGLKFSASGNVIVAGAAGEASLVVRLSYDGDAGG
jgi:hypothetical protein